MSDSRLEKFIYAICSMDVSDLPVPLSRIEKLWNCLITGETPDFEPLSRNEKYLMAMLDRYDISNLPAPMSRGEKLLYKIVVGETDLSDVPGYLSRYEELLKYLIENGGISEGDFEYVLYTLNQSLSTLYTTAEKPVKSAILKGQTLVNKMVNAAYRGNLNDLRPNSNMEFINTSGLARNILPMATSVFEPNKTYTIILFLDEIEDGGLDMTHTLAGKNATLKIGANKTLYTTPSRLDDNNYSHNTQIQCNFKARYMVLDGDYSNQDIPYFEGIQSVKMPVLTTTGKNLFGGILTSGQLLDNNVANNNQTKMGYSEFSPVEEKTDICCSYYTNSNYKIEKIFFYDENKTQIGSVTTPQKVTTPKGTKYFRFSITTTNWSSSVVFNDIKDDFKIQVETGTQTTPYEPYKSNILTVNEDVTLRGVGNVKDELDLLTGEVTERIGEIVLDGSENWVPFDLHDVDGYSTFVAIIPTLNNYYDSGTSFISADFATGSWNSYLGNKESEIVYNHDPNKIGIRVKNEKASNAKEIKTFLSTNNIRINYKLATPVIKTVDLTVVDQDNQPTQLGTFENVTHVSLEAENLIPEVEMEVATHISEELASASPLMDDISTEQQQLNETVNEQSNNVDATMIATTEIFEETL